MINVEDVTALDETISTAKAQLFINAVAERIKAHLERDLAPTTYAELYEGSGTNLLQAKHWPITEVKEVLINNTAIDLEANPVGIYGYHRDFFHRVDSTWPKSYRGRVPLTGHLYGHGAPNIKVTYRAGYSCIPADLSLAIAQEVVRWTYKDVTEPGTLVELRTPGGESRRWRSHADDSYKLQLSASILAILDDPRFKPPST